RSDLREISPRSARNFPARPHAGDLPADPRLAAADGRLVLAAAVGRAAVHRTADAAVIRRRTGGGRRHCAHPAARAGAGGCAGRLFAVPLTLLSFAAGLAVAFVTALIRLFGPAPLVALARFYVWLIRGTPLLVQLFVIFYGLPSVGSVLDPLPAALIGFTLNVGAYNSEVIRAAIEATPKGQWEAAYSLSMTRAQALRRTVLPQAARVAVPPLSNSFISLVKDT